MTLILQFANDFRPGVANTFQDLSFTEVEIFYPNQIGWSNSATISTNEESIV